MISKRIYGHFTRDSRDSDISEVTLNVIMDHVCVLGCD